MPQAEGGYVSLNNGPNSVYNTTTEPAGPKSVFESVKRAIGQAIGSGLEDDGLLISKGTQPFIISARDREKLGKPLNGRMPSAPAHTAEEARLLGTMPVDPMDDIELRSVQLQFPNGRGSLEGTCDLRRVVTDKGDILVAVQGDTAKPAILTYHDLGLNYATSFAGFFNYPTMRALLDNFCVYHVTAPGQEDGAPTLPEDYMYPTIDELSAQLLFVLSHFGLKSVIGFGVGAGANILARFALNNPDKVGALCLINCISTPSGWIEWGYQSFNARYLRSKGMTQGVVDYLMWHHFGRNPEERNHDLAQMYKSHFERSVNPTNLAMLINSYIHRTDLQIARTPSGSPQAAATLKMPVINITGALSPHVDDTVTLNGRLDPTNSSWMKISDCAMVLEEQPGKLAEAFRLFLQGEGYAHLPIISSNTRATKRTTINSAKPNRSAFINNDGIEIAATSLSLIDKYKSSTMNAFQVAAASTVTGKFHNPMNGNQNFLSQHFDDINNGNLCPSVGTTSFTTNGEENGNKNRNKTEIRITENPIPEAIVC